MKKFIMVTIVLCGLSNFQIKSSDYDESSSDDDSGLSVEQASPVLGLTLDEVKVKLNDDYDDRHPALSQVLEYAILDPAYYGNTNIDDIKKLYQEIQIKKHCVEYSLDEILHGAEVDSDYKGDFLYQDIVDMYYKINPKGHDQLVAAREALKAAGKGISINSITGATSGMVEFLNAYRKIPTENQDMTFYILTGQPIIEGYATSNAKVIVDWMKSHMERFASKHSDNIEIKKLLSLLDA